MHGQENKIKIKKNTDKNSASGSARAHLVAAEAEAHVAGRHAAEQSVAQNSGLVHARQRDVHSTAVDEPRSLVLQKTNNAPRVIHGEGVGGVWGRSKQASCARARTRFPCTHCGNTPWIPLSVRRASKWLSGLLGENTR